jgi:hypothetical protein
MMQNNDYRKLTFFDLWTRYCGFGASMITTIADLASVEKSVVDTMLTGTQVNRAEAVKVLTILSYHLGKWVTLDTIHVPVTESPHLISEVAHLSRSVVS